MVGEGEQHKAHIMEVLNAALDAADPYDVVFKALQSADTAKYDKIYVVGAGKAGAAMARAAEDALDQQIAGGLVIVKEGHLGEDPPPQRIELVEASHPVPDMRGADATSRLLRIAGEADAQSLVICLISGGGSALLSSTAEGISLQDLQTVTGLLLKAGATINEFNAVRKHLSASSGGQLARRASPAAVLSLILSDVIGSPLDVIASGPTAPDPTTFEDALNILTRYGLAERTPTPVLERLMRGAVGQFDETPKPGDPIFIRVENYVIASNVTAVEAAAMQAEEMGFNTLVVSTFIEGEAAEVGTVLAGVAKEIVANGRPIARPACVLFGGETTVRVRGRGIGGRNTELALSAALSLDGLGPNTLVASFATDGGDGNSPSAGAIADGTTIERARAKGLDPIAALDDNDSYTFWEALGDAIVTGPTGTNINDIMAVFVL